ncbi:MAG: hypothetical protein ABI333_12945 [bacterium]
MPERVLIVAPQALREGLERFFGARAEVLSLAREDAVTRQALVIEDERVLWHGADVIAGTLGAVVLDSGFMWPLPRLDPTPEQWREHAGRFDDWLRDERETASLWYSLLEILNDRLPRCVNPQRAFQHAALKPAAMAALERVGVPLPPRLTSNDAEAVEAFAAAAGELLWLPLSPELGEAAQWLEREAIPELPLTEEPVRLQRLDSREELTVIGVEGTVMAGAGDPPEEVTTALAVLQRTLAMPLVAASFRQAGGRWRLSDFSPAPALDALPGEQCDSVLTAVWDALRRRT